MAAEDTDIGEEVDAEIDIALLEGLAGHQADIALGADIEADLGALGPLATYMVEVRARAVEAVKRFTSIDLDDKPAIRDCQDAVRGYLDVMDFIKRALTRAEHGGEAIRREFSNPQGNPD